MAQEESIKAQAPQDAEEDALAAKKIARWIRDARRQPRQAAATPRI
jgi:hypothetical protein